MTRAAAQLGAALGVIACVTFAYTRALHVTNSTIVALTFLLVVLVVAAMSGLWIAVTTSIAAMMAFNFFFLPPVWTLRIADPENWVALFTFLAVSLIASNLSSAVRAHERDAAERRKAAELARQGEDLKSALLASLGHDLRTPLTAIRVAASNLQASWLTADERLEQTALVLAEVERLTRLFQNILEMARIESGGIAADERWAHPAEIVGAARDLVPQALRGHQVNVQMNAEVLVKVDPRLTAAALSHLLENAAHYSPADAAIDVAVNVGNEGLSLSVRDRGPGIPDADLPKLFERFYRGGHGKMRAAGMGMGLSIARGLVEAESGRITATNGPEGGAVSTIVVPAEHRPAESELAS